MERFIKYLTISFSFVIPMLCLTSCKDFLDPSQGILEENLYDDWYEYRSVAMGMYGVQQELVEQMFILGELRGDLVNITNNADNDLVEIYNFKPSANNKYTSPNNFFKLIAVTNNFIRILQHEQPEVIDPSSPVTNYDRLYGEALCMRAWAYFNAVRIYGKVPFIHESITTVEEIEEFLNSSGTYTKDIDIIYSRDGYYNDTIFNKTIELEKQFFDQDMIIDYFTNELKTKVKAVGVNHHIINEDITWEVTIWNMHAMNALLGVMYLTDGDLAKAAHYFEKIVYFQSDSYRYQLNQKFSGYNWRNIFTGIDRDEHIYTLWFNKSYFQKNNFQFFFEPRTPNKYMLKPTRTAVLKWETIWDNFIISENSTSPWLSKTTRKGDPGDFFRGYKVSYIYMQNGEPLDTASVRQMLDLKSYGDFRSAGSLVQDFDTVIWKYSINKDAFDQDANFIVYRAAGIHLWLAELYVYWMFERNQNIMTFTQNALNIVNNGNHYTGSTGQLGVRGRVGFGGVNDGIRVGNIVYERDPFTNKVVGYKNFTGNFSGLQLYLEEQILDERAREMAFEGERFYDLMRVAKRRNDPSFLAERVSKKYPEGKRDEIYNLLLDEKNWYINYFE